MTLPEPRLCRVEVVAKAPLSPRVRRLALAPRGPESLEWLPGQYVEVGVVGAEKRQPYSIASAPDPGRPGYFELAVLLGSGAGALDEINAGEMLEVFGPKGRFVREPGHPSAELFIGTGTGAAPLRAMIQAALAEGGPAPLTLLFGVRSEVEILWDEEFRAIAAREPRFHFEPTLTKPTNGWNGRRGRAQEHLVELMEPFREGRFYVCGVKEMVHECVAKLSGEHGIPKDRVFTEEH